MAARPRLLGDVRVGNDVYDVCVSHGELLGDWRKDNQVGVQISLELKDAAAARGRRSGFHRFRSGERYALRTSAGKLCDVLRDHFPEEPWADAERCIEQAVRALSFRPHGSGLVHRATGKPVMVLELAGPRAAEEEVQEQEDVLIEDLGWSFVLGLLDEEMNDGGARVNKAAALIGRHARAALARARAHLALQEEEDVASGIEDTSLGQEQEQNRGAVEEAASSASKDGMTETTATATRRNHRSEAKNGGTSPSTGNSGKTRQAQQEAETAFHNSKEEENDDHDNDDHIFSQEQTPPKTSGTNQTENSTTNKTKRKRAKKKTKKTRKIKKKNTTKTSTRADKTPTDGDPGDGDNLLSLEDMLEQSLESETPELSLALLQIKADLRKAHADESSDVVSSAARDVQRVLRGSVARKRVNAIRDEKKAQEAAARAGAEALAKAKAEAEAIAKAKAEADAIAAARAKAEAEAAARAEAEAAARAEAEARAKAEAEAEARAKAKAKADLEAKLRAKAQEDAQLAEKLAEEAREHAAMQAEMIEMIRQSKTEEEEEDMESMETTEEDETSSDESVGGRVNRRAGYVSENPQDVVSGGPRRDHSMLDDSMSDLTDADGEASEPASPTASPPSMYGPQEIHVHHHHHYHRSNIKGGAQNDASFAASTSSSSPKTKRAVGLKSPPRGHKDVLQDAYAPTSTSSAIGGGVVHHPFVNKSQTIVRKKKSAEDFSELFCEYSPRTLRGSVEELGRSVSPLSTSSSLSHSAASSPASKTSPSLSLRTTGAGRREQPGASTMRRILVGDIEHAELSPPRPPVRGARRPPLSVSVMSRSVREQRTLEDRQDRRSKYIQNSLLASLATHGRSATAKSEDSIADDVDATMKIEATRSKGAHRHDAEKQRRHERRRTERRRRRHAKRLKKNREKARKEMQREHDELYESNRYKALPMQLWLGGEEQNAGAFFGKRRIMAQKKDGRGNKLAWGAGTEAAKKKSFSYNASQLSQSLPHLPRLHWRQAEREKAEKKSRDALAGQHQWRKRVDSLLAKYHY